MAHADKSGDFTESDRAKRTDEPIDDLSEAGQDERLELLCIGAEAQDPKEFLGQFAEGAKSAAGANAIRIWFADKSSGRFELITPVPKELDASDYALSSEDLERVSLIGTRRSPYPMPWAANCSERLVAWLRAFGQGVGLIEVEFTGRQQKEPRLSSIVKKLAERASVALQGVWRARVGRDLNWALSAIAQANTLDELDQLLLEGAQTVTGCKIGSVLRLDTETGKLNLSKCAPIVEDQLDLSMDDGITGHSLRTLGPIRLGDVSTHKYFKEYWKGIRSELAIPLYVPNSSVRVASADAFGTKIIEAPNRLGVLNLESPLREAFSAFEEECMTRLAATASVVTDRLKAGETLRLLNEAESELAKQFAAGHDWLDVVQKVGGYLQATLAFSHINISLISPDGKRIKSEYLWWGRRNEETEAFRRLSDHEIATSNDIQAHVVRSKLVEVPDPDDPRFHPRIHNRFGLDRLIRIYIPMMMGDVVVGTLEAGYPRRFRKFIFEREVQILRVLADYAAAAIWRRRRGLLDVLRHEIAASRKSLSDNANFLRRNWARLSSEKIDWKLSDIELDSDVLDTLLNKVEYYLTGKPTETKWVDCHVGMAVIMKTILHQNHVIRTLELPSAAPIAYSRDELVRVRTMADPIKMSEVFNNLIGNAIKYRKPSGNLQIEVRVETTPARYLVRVIDHGIGVEPGFEDRVFEEGFRTPLAVSRATGSGLGLWIAQQSMREMGGDIVLESPRAPTIFRVEIARREPGDSIHR